MLVNDEIKTAIKEWSAGFVLFALILLAGTMEFSDEVAQHKINCASATFVNDNNLECD